MAVQVRLVDYYYVIVEDRPGAAYRLLKQMSSADISLLAFNVIPLGMEKTQLVVFPENVQGLARVAEKLGLTLQGPHRAFLIQGDDELGAIVDLHRMLYDAQVNILSSSGVTDGRGGYGYVVYVRSQDYEAAARALGL